MFALPTAFAAPAAYPGPHSSRALRGVRRPRSILIHPPPLLRRPFAVACDRNSPTSSASTGASEPTQETAPEPPAGPSRTLVGRALVEVLSLIAGAALLLVVVVWRASHVVLLTAWRALLWLSNLRRLGKWAVGRVVHGGGVVRSVREAAAALLAWVPKTGAASSVAKVEETRSREGLEQMQWEIERMKERIGENEGVAEVEGESVGMEGREGWTGAKTRRLVLVRHAKTMWDRQSEIPDHDRVLSAQGKEEARLVGSELVSRSWVPDVVLCSDAVRTVQTLRLLNVAERKAQADTLCTDTLYYAVTGEEMAMAVDEALGGRGFVDRMTLLVVCHNPGCEELVEQLTGHRPAMGTGCAAMLEFSGERTERVPLAARREEWRLVEVLNPAALAGAGTGRRE